MIVKRQFHNIQCDHCGTLIDEETWYDDVDALKTTVLDECGWIECEGRHYCESCWAHDDDDNIVTSDGRKWTDYDHKEILTDEQCYHLDYLKDLLDPQLTVTQLRMEIIKAIHLYHSMVGTLYKDALHDEIDGAYRLFNDRMASASESENWHDASTPPYDKNADRDIYIVTRNQNNRLETWHIFSYMTWEWVEEHADGKVVYWAYLKDILDLTHSVTKISDQEPVNESLEEAAGKYGANVTHPQYYTKNGAPVGIGGELSDAVIYGANWQKEQTIRKSCEWLRENIYQRVYKEGDSLGFPTAVFLEDFRKAMEE